MTYAKIIADSISPEGVRLTTMEVRFHRFVLAEFNTHRVFSRNSASSRAIPVRKQIERIQTDLAYPVSWPVEQKGMQGGAEMSPGLRIDARDTWHKAMGAAVKAVRSLTDREDSPLHKSVANRLLEPWMWHTVVCTATAWQNFFDLRLDVDAQPEIRVAAEAMKKAYDASTPVPLEEAGRPYTGTNIQGEPVAGFTVGGWHAPYIDMTPGSEDMRALMAYADPERPHYATEVMVKVSAARCARTSYLTQDGKRDMDEDLALYDRLVTDRVEAGKGVHWSPLEHVATPWKKNRQEGGVGWIDPHTGAYIEASVEHLPMVGNLLGWRSLRTEVEATHNQRTFR